MQDKKLDNKAQITFSIIQNRKIHVELKLTKSLRRLTPFISITVTQNFF